MISPRSKLFETSNDNVCGGGGGDRISLISMQNDEHSLNEDTIS